MTSEKDIVWRCLDASDDHAIETFAPYAVKDLRDAAAEIERLRAHVEQLNAKLTCMCGNYVADHGMGDGHSPVSMYDYALDNALKDLTAANARASEMRAALEFYADPFAWKKKYDPDNNIQVPDFYSETSFGDTALAALTLPSGGGD